MKKQIIIALAAILSIATGTLAQNTVSAGQDSCSAYQALASEAQKVKFIEDPGVELRSIVAQDSLKQVVFNIYLVSMPLYMKSLSHGKVEYSSRKYTLSEVKSFEKEIYKWCKSLPAEQRKALAMKNGTIYFKFFDDNYNGTGKEVMVNLIKMTKKEYLSKKEFYQIDDAGSYRW